MSTKFAGLTLLSFMRGTRLCPPARIFESFNSRRDIASEIEVGECNSKRRGIITTLYAYQKTRYVFLRNIADPIGGSPSTPRGRLASLDPRAENWLGNALRDVHPLEICEGDSNGCGRINRDQQC